MAETRRRNRLKTRTRRAPLTLRLLRIAAGVSVLGLAGLLAYEALVRAGFELRLSVEDPNGPPSVTGRLAVPPVRPPAARASASSPRPVEDGALEAPPAFESSAGAGTRARIDFESFADDRPFCTNCPVSDHWRGQGVVLSFRSWTASATEPYVLDARNFLPSDASKHAIGPAQSGERGLEVGVTRLDFPDRPRKVSFTLYGPDLIKSFAITAWSAGHRLTATSQTRSLVERYSPLGRSPFRAERVVIESTNGVDRISLDGWGPPGHLLLVDNLVIDP